MQTIDLLVLPRWLVPVEPAGVVLEEHALAVDGGRIVDVLPAAFARQSFQAREVLELPDHAVLPGLVNIHTHAAMNLLRGLADDLPLMDWLQNHIWPAEGANVSYAFCADGVRLAAAEMIRGGTTCFNDMYFFPDATAAVAAEIGLRANVGLWCSTSPPPGRRTGRTTSIAGWKCTTACAAPRWCAPCSRRTRPTPCPTRR